MSRQCFILCLDDVATEGPLSWSRQPRQEVRVALAWLRPKKFRSQREICFVATRFHGLYRDIVGQARTIFIAIEDF